MDYSDIFERVFGFDKINTSVYCNQVLMQCHISLAHPACIILVVWKYVDLEISILSIVCGSKRLFINGKWDIGKQIS